jgi:uncharacterized membrane protein YbhN (UPF0104 family)
MELIPNELVVTPSGRRTSTPRRLGRLFLIAATVCYLAWLVISNWGDLDRAVLRLRGASWRWIAIAVLIEMVAQVAGGLVMRQLLTGAGHRLRAGEAIRLVMAQNAIGLIVPGGPVAGNTFAFRHLRRSGLDPAATTWVLTGASTVSMLAVVLLGVVAQSGADLSSVISIIGLGLVVTGLVGIVRYPHIVRRPVRIALTVNPYRRRRPHGTLQEDVDRVIARLGSVRLSGREWLLVGLFAVFAAATDFLALACCARALIRLPIGCTRPMVATRIARACARYREPTLARILLVYVAGQAASFIPLVPGGIGPTEAAMTATFAAGRIRTVPALSAVLIYRVLSYWGVILVGLACWWGLRRRHRSET